MARPRKPTHLKVVEGTYRPDRAPRSELRPKRIKTPRPPAHLSAAAARAWRQLARVLDKMGILSIADLAALEAMAGALADLRAARASLARPMIERVVDAEGKETTREIASGGSRYYANGGIYRRRPELADLADADRRLATWCGKFGLSPADRTKIEAPEPGSGRNPFANLG